MAPWVKVLTMEALGPESGFPELMEKPNVFWQARSWRQENRQVSWPIVLTIEANERDSASKEAEGEGMSRSSSNLCV